MSPTTGGSYAWLSRQNHSAAACDIALDSARLYWTSVISLCRAGVPGSAGTPSNAGGDASDTVRPCGASGAPVIPAETRLGVQT